MEGAELQKVVLRHRLMAVTYSPWAAALDR